VKPDVFAAVMATGIVSIAAADHGYHIISDVLAVLAAVGLPILIVEDLPVAVKRQTVDFDGDLLFRECPAGHFARLHPPARDRAAAFARRVASNGSRLSAR
jgi:hypothetical protein